MRHFLLLAALVSLAFAPVPVSKEKGTDDLKHLQGNWLRVRVTIDRVVYKETTRETTIVIDGNRMKYSVAGKPTNDWVFTLDPKARPTRFDRKGTAGAAKGLNYLGIYRIEGDTFVLCSCDGRRPDDFSGAGPGVFIEIYKRMKP